MPSYSDLATPSATKKVLDAFDLAPKKSFGQNFLVNDDVIRKILELADVTGDDGVLEVGPGIGTLTNALLKRARFVVAVERDPSLPEVLSYTLAPWKDRFALVEKDALALDVSDIEAALGESVKANIATPNKMVANLPYSVAATIILDYFCRFDFLMSQTVMVQKEVADRICASPGSKNYGAYTVKLAMYAGAAGSFKVGPHNFMPPPHVDSAVVKLIRHPQDRASGSKELVEASCTMADAAFASRRKTLSNSCKAFFAGRGEAGKRISSMLPEIFAAADVDGTVRGEVLSVNDYMRLGAALIEQMQV